MVLESNRELVLRRLTECLGRDRTKHQVAEVTSLGLVQMTRKRVGQGLLEAYSEPCPTCGGRGHTIELPSLGGVSKPKPKPVPRRVATASDDVDQDTVDQDAAVDTEVAEVVDVDETADVETDDAAETPTVDADSTESTDLNAADAAAVDEDDAEASLSSPDDAAGEVREAQEAEEERARALAE